MYASVLSDTKQSGIGWNAMRKTYQQIVSVAQRWQKSGMPNTREGRLVYALPEELTAWVGTERGQKESIHIASEGEDMIADLNHGSPMFADNRRIQNRSP